MLFTFNAFLALMLGAIAAFAAPTLARGGPKGGADLARIEGVVVTEGGDTVADARVTLQRKGETDFVQARTNSRGRFRFSKVVPGTYTVSAFFGIKGTPPGIFLPELFGTVDVQIGAGDRAAVMIVVMPVG